MKRLCFGTAFKILCQAKANITDEKLLHALYAVYGVDGTLIGSQTTHIKSGHDNVPRELVEKAKCLPYQEVEISFQEKVIPHLRNEMKKPIVLAFLDVLQEDKTIDDEAIIGYITGYEKKKLISSDVFNFSSFLTSVFFYAIVFTSNKDCKNSIKEIDKEYVSSFIHKGDSIDFESTASSNITPLKTTLNDSTFNSIFEKVFEMPISNSYNTSNLQIYSVDILNNTFRFKSMKEFIIRNIAEYVMSRQRINNVDKYTKLTAIGADAVLKYINASNASLDTILSETLLYVFLEKGLIAPKIMSKIEINDINGKSKSDGVHLYRFDRLGLPFHQIVFGSSNIVGDMKSAIDNIFAKVIEIKENADNELQMVESTINEKYFSQNEIEYLVKVLIPQKDKSISADLAFGCFVGYTFEMPTQGMSNEEFKRYAKKKMEEDIIKIQPYIAGKILEKGLLNYSFYFYILPFNNADKEKETIVKEIRGGN